MQISRATISILLGFEGMVEDYTKHLPAQQFLAATREKSAISLAVQALSATANVQASTADGSLNCRQTIRVGASVAFAQVGIVGFDGQIEIEALRFFGLPEAAPAVLYACPSVPIGTRSLALETTWDLPNLTAGSTTNTDVPVPGARRGDFADVSLDTSSIAFVLDCHVWSNNSVRVMARNVSASTVDLAAAALSVQLVKRRVP